MHPDDLKIVWLCCECGRKLAFNSDVEDHKQQYKHSKMKLCHLQASGALLPALFTRGRMSLGFRFNGKTSRVIVEYEYYPSNDTISYVDVRYTDDKLKFKVESNPSMMKNIDNYLRKLLTQNLSGKQ
jgi:hypothetical protein